MALKRVIDADITLRKSAAFAQSASQLFLEKCGTQMALKRVIDADKNLRKSAVSEVTLSRCKK